jgi:NAD(P)H-nitrite reductase large subunit
MVMDRDIIVAKMVIIAEKNNEQAMQSSGMDDKAMAIMKDQVRSQLFKIQGEILDTLVEEGFITIN